MVAESPKLSTEAGQGALIASAARAKTQDALDPDVRPLWATVNICDTQRAPNALGVRTSVPGNGSNQRIFARYTAQWWSSAKQEWQTVGGSGVTDWVPLGNADMTSRQAGWTFHFVQPPAGKTYVMRGAVELQWRGFVKQARRSHKGRRAHNSARRAARKPQRLRIAVVRKRTLLTATGMKHVEGGDPVGLSKAMCLIW